MKYDLTIEEMRSLPDAIYRVGVVEQNTSNIAGEHTVSIERVYVDSLGWADDDVAGLLEESFNFLLSKEPPDSILPEFNLRDIKKYFPEYEEEIIKMKR